MADLKSIDDVIDPNHTLNLNIPNSDSDLTSEFASLPIPPFDFLYFSSTQDIHSSAGTGADFRIGDDGGEFDLDFSFDFDLPEDGVDIFGGMETDVEVGGGVGGADRGSPMDSKDSNSVGNSEEHKVSEVVEVLDCACDENGGCEEACDRVFAADADRNSNSSSPMIKSSSSEVVPKIETTGESPSHDYEGSNQEVSAGPASSQGSGNVGSGSEAMDVSSKLGEYRIKVEEEGTKSMPKRKKVSVDGINESRSSKFRKASANLETDANEGGGGGLDDEKRKARLMRNRESAQLSRQRKKHYVEELEDKVRAMHATITDLNGKISYIMAENASLRQQLGSGVMCPPPPGVYAHHPMAPVGYPWMPCPPYAMNGSQTPVVPIPRLKPQQQPVAAPKLKKTDSKKSEGKKTEVKTKKVASVSLLGLLFFLFLFGGLVPMVNFKYGGVGSQVHPNDRILTVNGDSNRSRNLMGSGFFKGKYDYDDEGRRFRKSNVEGKMEAGARHGESVKEGNSSLPLIASLYVPRNDKLVKINGNLIIHSVLASEKAMASHKATDRQKNEKTGLAVAKNVAPAWDYSEAGKNRDRQPHIYRNPSERRRALADSSKASADDPQQWFREGLAGPMLSSGLCTEVFQFDMSPEANSGAVIPASTAEMNTSANRRANSTQLSKRINRRSLHGLPNRQNITKEPMESNSTKEGLHGNKSVTPMIVSVLVDPKEAGDGESDGIMGPKSIPRIFVVVLLERVKYVTYSCMLPIKGSSPHLVPT